MYRMDIVFRCSAFFCVVEIANRNGIVNIKIGTVVDSVCSNVIHVVHVLGSFKYVINSRINMNSQYSEILLIILIVYVPSYTRKPII